MLRKSIVLFIVLAFAISFNTACASKKYVRTNVNERVAPLEGRTAELEDSSRSLKNQTDLLNNRTGSLEEKSTKLQKDLNDLDERSTQGIQQAKDNALQARKDSLAETAKVEGQVNNRINSLDNWETQEQVTLFFKTNQSILTTDGKNQLNKLIDLVSIQKGYLIEIKGFTDSVGAIDTNRKLSQQRANSVFQYLVEKDIPPYKINLAGLGELKPISDNATKLGRKENRRVEVRLLVNQGIKQDLPKVNP
jgi:outer membrane protein OmpA-like peptidoglycan-associated protein